MFDVLNAAAHGTLRTGDERHDPTNRRYESNNREQKNEQEQPCSGMEDV